MTPLAGVRRVILGACLLAATLAACTPPAGPDGVAGGAEPIAGDTTGATVGQPAPNFSLTTPEGETVELARLRGAPVVLNFWATWCGPCRAEMPELQAIYEDRRPRGLHVIGVDIQDSAEAVTAFRRSLGITFPTPLDSDGAVTRRYLVRGVPTTIVIDSDGIVRDIHVGPINRRALDQKLAQVS